MVQLYEILERFLVLYMWTRDHDQSRTGQDQYILFYPYVAGYTYCLTQAKYRVLRS